MLMPLVLPWGVTEVSIRTNRLEFCIKTCCTGQMIQMFQLHLLNSYFQSLCEGKEKRIRHGQVGREENSGKKLRSQETEMGVSGAWNVSPHPTHGACAPCGMCNPQYSNPKTTKLFHPFISLTKTPKTVEPQRNRVIIQGQGPSLGNQGKELICSNNGLFPKSHICATSMVKE